MDAAAAPRSPPGATAAQGGRHQRADGREDDRGVQLVGRALVRAAGPHGAELARQRLGGVVAGADDRVDLPPLPAQDLRHDVGRRAEPVEAHPSRVAAHRRAR